MKIVIISSHLTPCEAQGDPPFTFSGFARGKGDCFELETGFGFGGGGVLNRKFSNFS